MMTRTTILSFLFFFSLSPRLSHRDREGDELRELSHDLLVPVGQQRTAREERVVDDVRLVEHVFVSDRDEGVVMMMVVRIMTRSEGWW